MRAKAAVGVLLAVGLAAAGWRYATGPRGRRLPPRPPEPAAVAEVPPPPAEVAREPEPAARPAAVPAPPAAARGGGQVRGLAFGPDGWLVAAGSDDGVLSFCGPGPLASWGEVRTPCPIGAVVFTPDGKSVATGGADGVVRLWDARTLAPAGELAGHVGAVRCLAVTPAGELASGGVDGTVRYWDVAARRLRRTDAAYPGGTVGGLGVGGGRLVSAGWLGQVNDARRADFVFPARVWDPAGGGGRELPLRPGPLAVDPTGRYLAGRVLETADGPRGRPVERMVLADAATGKVLAELDSGPASGVAFSPDGRVVLTQGGGGEWQFWEAATGGCVHRSGGHGCRAPVTFSPSGRHAACGGTNGLVHFHDWPPDRDRWAREAAAADPERLWADLTGADAGAGHRAAWMAAGLPRRWVPVLAARGNPPAPDAGRIPALIADLDAPDFPTREAASKELRRLGAAAAPALRAAAVGTRSAEMRRRAEQLLAALGPDFPLRGDALRAVRVVMALELSTAPAAHDLLRRWAADPAADRRLAAEAARAVARLGAGGVEPPPAGR